MKRLLAVLAMLLSAQAYAADWVKVGEKVDSDLYYDASAIANKEKRKEVWVLVDYKNPQPFDDKNYMSTKRLLLISCSGRNFANRSMLFYSKGMAQGEVINNTTFEKTEMAGIPPDSGVERVYVEACR